MGGCICKEQMFLMSKNERIASLSKDRTLKLWDKNKEKSHTHKEQEILDFITSTKRESIFTPEYGGYDFMILLKDSSTIAAITILGWLELYDFRRRKMKGCFELQKIGAPIIELERSSSSSSSKGVVLAGATRDNKIRTLNMRGEVENNLEGHSDTITTLKEHSNGQLLSGSKDSSVRFWTLNPPNCLLTLKHPTASVISGIEELPQESLILTLCLNSIYAYIIWNISSGEQISQFTPIPESPEGFSSILHLGMGRYALGGTRGTISLLQGDYTQLTHTWRVHTSRGSIKSLALLDHDTVVSCATADLNIAITNISNGEITQIIAAHTDQITQIITLNLK